jgi:uncharacterized LabA/DUF88 family protein
MTEDHTTHAIAPERIGLFIDGRYLSEAARALGIYIDYEKLLGHYRAKGHVARAFYYNAVLPGPDGAAASAFYQWLDCRGYATEIKQATQFIDDKGVRRVMADLEVDIVLDMLEMAPYLDHVVLVAGQDDLCRLLEAMKRKGVRVTVVSMMHDLVRTAVSELRRVADCFDDLRDLAPLIRRERRRTIGTMSS